MAQCSRCGVETKLYLVGIAICPHCDDLLQQLATNLNSGNPTPELFLVKKEGATA